MIMQWKDEIVQAFSRLGGAARYADLYEYIIRTSERDLSPEWKATVRRTIEDHSSDSLNFRANDLFMKLGHGHWGLRDAKVSEEELLRREKLSPKELVKEVFVREHWRSLPGEGDDSTVLLSSEQLIAVTAWCTNIKLELELKSGAIISAPISWFPKLAAASPDQRSKFVIAQNVLDWPELNEHITVVQTLLGRGLES
jgi:hypothetical protein